MAECRIVDDGRRDGSAHVALPNTSAGSAGPSKPSAPFESSNLSGPSEAQRRVGRLAPSPTGRMHIGNVYAALAAWLSVRAPHPSAPNGDHRPGVLRLRIEDIDTPRVRKDADRWIMDDLHWLGLDWDGDPVYQSKRGDLYDQALHDLREADLIYPCFCSRAEIRAASAPQEGDGYVIYPGTCARLDPAERDRQLAEGRRHSWRVHLSAAEQRFDDTVFGGQRFDLARQIGDTVLRRSDGLYAYQLAVVVDDLLMGVNDVVRGRDLLRSTALQLWIRDQLSTAGWHAVDSADNSGDIPTRPETLPVPEALPNPETTPEASRIPAPIHFAHLPLVDDPSGKRLAKRDRALDLGVLREEGVTPEAVIGYCAWLLRLQETPQPVSARDLLTDFSWEPLRADYEDRVCGPTVLFG